MKWRWIWAKEIRVCLRFNSNDMKRSLERFKTPTPPINTWLLINESSMAVQIDVRSAAYPLGVSTSMFLACSGRWNLVQKEEEELENKEKAMEGF